MVEREAVIIHPLEENDTRALARLVVSIGEEVRLLSIFERICAAELFDAQKFPTVLVADDGEQLTGLVFLESFANPHKAHVNKVGMYIRPEYRRSGLSRDLYLAAREQAIRRGIVKIWMSAYADNEVVLRLARSLGFVQEGLFKNEEVWDGQFRDIVSMADYLKEV